MGTGGLASKIDNHSRIMHGASMRSHRRWPSSFSALLLVGLVACGSSGPSGGGGRLQVAASFYPLAWVAEQVGGDRVDVHSLTKPGAEPHDLELTPRDVGAVVDADLIVYLSGFQPSVDEAVGQADDARVFDARPAAKLDLISTPIEGVDDEAGSPDPHFWLDPTRLADVAGDLGDVLARRDPDHAATYRANAKAVVARLGALDGRYREALQDCEHKDLVTSHDAFGYLARRYGLRQVAVSGLSPEAEPTPGDLARTAKFVEDNDVRTIYLEPLASPATAKAVASEAGVRTDVLDPIEGLDDGSQGDDYLAVMRANLANLVRGQPCR